MSQDKTTLEANHDKLVLLREAAWMLLASHLVNQIDFDEVADMAGVDRDLAGALSGSVQHLVLAKMSELDRQSLMETYDDIQDAGAVSVREKITESLLHWYETYSPYRLQIPS